MPSWKEIETTDEYKKLPEDQQQVTKFQFYNDTVTQSPKYQQLSVEEQNKVHNDFFPKGEDNKIMFREGMKGLGKSFKELPGIKQGDQVVNKVADVVSGEIKPDANPYIQFPRYLAGETIRGFEPSTMLPFLGAMKLAKPALAPVGKLAWKAVPDNYKKVLLRNLTVGKGQPEAYQQLAKATKLSRDSGAREAVKVAETLSTNPTTGKPLSQEEQRYMGRIFRKEIDTGSKPIPTPEAQGGTMIDTSAPIQSQLTKHPKYQLLKSISDEGRSVMDKWSQELIKSGIPKKETEEVIKGNLGSYMARMFDKHLAEGSLPFDSKAVRLKLNGLKQRKELSDEVLKKLGEIKEPAFPTAIRVREISSSVANDKLFKTVANNPEWSSMFPQPGMVKMPASEGLGALKGKWVNQEIADDVNAITSIQRTGASLKLYSKALSAWKYGKVVLNPATHARNMISNSILLDLSGVNHLRQMQLFPQVALDYINKGKLYKMALEDGAIGGEFAGNEVAKIHEYYNAGQGGHMSKLFNTLKIPFQKAASIYQGEEQLSKLIKYQDVLLKGGTREQAAKESQKWLFNYNEIPNFIGVVKQAAPFITFTYKSVPRIAESLVNNPLKIYKYKAFADGFNNASQKMTGMDPVEYAKQKKLLPDWLMQSIGGVPANLLMPYRDKYNRTQWLNLEYILPIGMAPEIMEKGLTAVVSNPMFTLVKDLMNGTDFKGRPIVKPQAEGGDATVQTLEYIYRQLAPSLSPGLYNLNGKGDAKGESMFKGGYSFDKLISTFYKKPDYADRMKDIPPVLLDTLLGLKITPLDMDEAESFKMYDNKRKLDDLTKELYRLQHPAISEETRQKETEKVFRAMQKISSEM